MSIASFPFDVLINIFELEVARKDPRSAAFLHWAPTHKGTGFAGYSLVCRAWRLPAQGILFRRVLLTPEKADKFYAAIKNNEFLRKCVRNLHFLKATEGATRSSTVPESCTSIIKLLGPTLLYLTLPRLLNLQDFPYSTFSQLVSLDANIVATKPPKATQSYSYRDPDDSDDYYSGEEDEDLDFDIYGEDFVSKNDNNFTPLHQGSIRLTTLTLTTVRPSSEFLNIISSVGSTLINLSLYFQHSINFEQGVTTFATTYKTLRRFRYHYNSEFTTPSRLLEYIVPRFKKLEVLSTYGDMIPSNILGIMPATLKYLEIDDIEGYVNLTALVEPLRITPSTSKILTLKKIVIINEEREDMTYEYRSDIKFLKTKKVSVDIVGKEIEQSAFFKLC